jgi:nitrite reductase/ring-hydroxylating ferredoxin subunit
LRFGVCAKFPGHDHWRRKAMSIMPNSTLSSGNGLAERNTACSPQEEWQVLTGLRPDAPTYPARATIGGEGIVVFRTKTGLRGVQRACPHMQATMMTAELTGNETMIRCSFHAFTFKLADGKGVNCPGYRIRVYEIREENGTFYGRCVT